MKRPSFSELTPEQQLMFGNGVGPYWSPSWFRKAVTDTASWFFKDASWRHHDFGYIVGGDRWDRARADWKFLVAMLKDAWSQPSKWAFITIPVAVLLALVFFLAVRIGGQFGSFKYRKAYATLSEVIAVFDEEHQVTT